MSDDRSRAPLTVADLSRVERWLRAYTDGDADGAAAAAAAEWECTLLRRCAALFSLTRAETDVLALALSVEIDGRAGEAFAQIQGAPGLRRPRVGTLAAMIGGADWTTVVAAMATGAHLIRCGLLRHDDPAPLPTRCVRIPDEFWPRLVGWPAVSALPVTSAGARLAELVIPAETARQVAQVLSRARAAGAHRAMIRVIGRPGSGRHAIAAGLAQELGYATIRVDDAMFDRGAIAADLVRETTWGHAAVLVDGQPSVETLTRLAGELAVPIVVVAAVDDAVDVVAHARSAAPERWSADVLLAEFDAGSREALWRQQLAGVRLGPSVDLRALAGRQLAGPGRIVATAAKVRSHATMTGQMIERRDLRAADRCDSAVGAIAQRVEPVVRFDDLIVPAATRRELELALAWARYSPALFHPDGAGGPMRGATGLTCLFHGPPGTGKTMAAHALATALDADVLRVDLAQVVDKYVGETEKHLARVFDGAAATGALLFFDEADALFGKRSEVKDAHDRYANIETAYLLQRLEQHPGVCVLATNLRHNLDDAFMRRFQIVVEFPVPNAGERERLWRHHLPTASRAPDVAFAVLAERATLSGGDIRNASATALVLAAADETLVTMRHLVIATWRELRKSGRLVSADDFGAWRQVILDHLGASP